MTFFHSALSSQNVSWLTCFSYKASTALILIFFFFLVFYFILFYFFNFDLLWKYKSKFFFSLYVCVLSHSWLLVSPWTVTCQAPLSMDFSRQEYSSGLPFPSPGVLPNPGIEHASPAFPGLAGEFFATATPGKSFFFIKLIFIKDQNNEPNITLDDGEERGIEPLFTNKFISKNKSR